MVYSIFEVSCEYEITGANNIRLGKPIMQSCNLLIKLYRAKMEGADMARNVAKCALYIGFFKKLETFTLS